MVIDNTDYFRMEDDEVPKFVPRRLNPRQIVDAHWRRIRGY